MMALALNNPQSLICQASPNQPRHFQKCALHHIANLNERNPEKRQKVKRC